MFSAKHGDFVLFTCFFDPATRYCSILQQAWGLSVYTSPYGECTVIPSYWFSTKPGASCVLGYAGS